MESNATSASNSTAALGAALRNNSLGVGFSGSGALILYFTGVTAVLKQLGIINSNTSLAGASGGATNALLTCADVPLQQQYTTLTGLASKCRAANNCQGFLDTALNASLSSLVPANASEACSGRLWVAATVAKPGGANDSSVLLGSRWNSTREIVAAARVSAYLPGISSPSATEQVPELPSLGYAYDGGFSDALPCPPDAAYCIKVAPVPYTPGAPAGDGGSEAVITFYNQAASSPLAKARADADPATGPFLPLNPTATPAPAPDIFPGLSKPLPVNATEWNSWGLNIPSNTTLKMVFDMGRLDAAFWASKEGLASAAAATSALQATALSH